MLDRSENFVKLQSVTPEPYDHEKTQQKTHFIIIIIIILLHLWQVLYGTRQNEFDRPTT